MKRALIIFFVFMLAGPGTATMDWVYRKEYKKLQYAELIEKAVGLTQNTNRLTKTIVQKNKEIEKLQWKLDRPFRNVIFGIILALVLVGVTVIAILTVRVVFFFMRKK